MSFSTAIITCNVSFSFPFSFSFTFSTFSCQRLFFFLFLERCRSGCLLLRLLPLLSTGLRTSAERGRTKTLDVTSDFTASDIKAGVSPKAGYSLLDEPTYIKRCGTVMTDAMTLGQLGVGKGDQVHVLTQLPGGMPTSEELTNAFMKFDRDGDGYLSPAELKAILCRPTPDGKTKTLHRVGRLALGIGGVVFITRYSSLS